MGTPIGLLVSWGLRYRLLWLWVFRWAFSYESFGGLGVET